MMVSNTLSTVAASFLLMFGTAQAQTFQPDIREFVAGDDLSFAGNTAFDIHAQGTVELWVAPGWHNDPGYDPVILYHASEKSVQFVLSMLGDRTGLSLQTATGIDELEFSFADDQLHHIALVNLNNSVGLMIDGQTVGAFQVLLPKVSSYQFRLGSAPGPKGEFIGALGGIRLWDVTLDQESLVAYALRDPLNMAHLHPDLESLKAVSNLNLNTMELMQEQDADQAEQSNLQQ